MKKRIFAQLTLILVFTVATGFVLSRSAQTMVSVSARDFPEYGLTFVKAGDPEFDRLAVEHLGAVPPEFVDSLMPFSVFLRNSGDKFVVAYAMCGKACRLGSSKARH